MAPTHSLTTDAFARLRKDSAWARCTGSLHGIQRAVASLGHCDPPSLSKHGSMPAIDGTAETWAAWGERWYGTPTLTLKVRRTFRVNMAKAGRWPAEEHPELTEPSGHGQPGRPARRRFGGVAAEPLHLTHREDDPPLGL